MSEVVEKKETKTHCAYCNGTTVLKCPCCLGKGYLPQFHGVTWLMSICWCPTCSGKGVIPCKHCSPESVIDEA